MSFKMPRTCVVACFDCSASALTCSTVTSPAIAGGDLATSAGVSDVFDSFVDAGVKRFQARHGLTVDGIVREGLFERVEKIFEAFGWDVVRVKYGVLQRAAFAEPGGEKCRRLAQAAADLRQLARPEYHQSDHEYHQEFLQS